MKIEWTKPVLLDLESIRDYIRRDSKYYATRFAERIIEAVESLKKFPEMGRSFPEAEQENVRELLFYNYRIMYRVETERIFNSHYYTRGTELESEETQAMGRRIAVYLVRADALIKIAFGNFRCI